MVVLIGDIVLVGDVDMFILGGSSGYVRFIFVLFSSIVGVFIYIFFFIM